MILANRMDVVSLSQIRIRASLIEHFLGVREHFSYINVIYHHFVHYHHFASKQNNLISSTPEIRQSSCD